MCLGDEGRGGLEVELTTVGWSAGWLFGCMASAGRSRPSLPMGQHKELKLTCSMIARRENPLSDYIHNMFRLWNCMAGGDKEPQPAVLLSSIVRRGSEEGVTSCSAV